MSYVNVVALSTRLEHITSSGTHHVLIIVYTKRELNQICNTGVNKCKHVKIGY